MSFLGLAIPMSWGAGPSAPTASGGGSISWDPKTFSFAPECARASFPNATCIIAMAPDAEGNLHVFVALDPLIGPSKNGRPIGHYLFSQGDMRVLPSVRTRHVGATALTAASGPSGDLSLLWVEDEHSDPESHPPPKYHASALYLRRFKAGTWGDPMLVSDKEAKVSGFPRHLALSSHSDGSLDLFWEDSREHHAFVDVMPGGGTGLVTKTYHRRFTEKGVEDTKRVQPSGYYNADTFDLMSAGGEAHDVIWSDDKTVTVKRSTQAQGRWSVTETVAHCAPGPGEIGRPAIFRIEVAPLAGEHPPVAWVCSRYEGERLFDLHISTFSGGAWQPGPRIMRKAAAMKWLAWGPTGGFLLVQETRSGASGRNREPVALSLLRIEGARSVESSVFSDRAVPGPLEAAIGPSRTVHVIYAEVDALGKVEMKYRRGNGS